MSIRFKGGGGGGGSGAFGAILQQTATEGAAAAVLASPTRIDTQDRPDAASDEWDNSIGGFVNASASVLFGPAGAQLRVTADTAGAAGNEIQIVIQSGSNTSVNVSGSTITFTHANIQNVQAAYIASFINTNNAASALVTAAAVGTSQTPISNFNGTYRLSGGVVHHSQVYIISRTGTAAVAGLDSNISIAIVEADTNNAAGTMDWNADDRVLTAYAATAGTGLLGWGGGSGFTAGLSAAGAPLAAVLGDPDAGEDGISGGDALIYPGQRIDWTGGANRVDAADDPLRGLFIYSDATDPGWELRATERTRDETAVGAMIEYQAGASNTLDIELGDPDNNRRWFTDGAPFGQTNPEDWNAVILRHVEVDDWRALAAQAETPDGDVIFRARTPGAAGNSLRVRALAGTPATPATDADAINISGVDPDDDTSTGGSVILRPPFAAAAGNGVEVRTIAPNAPATPAVAATAQGVRTNRGGLTFTAATAGAAGNDITVVIQRGVFPNLGVGVSGNTVTVTVTSSQSITDVIAYITNSRSASALVAVSTFSTSGVSATLDSLLPVTVNLSGGADAVPGASLNPFARAWLHYNDTPQDRSNSEIILSSTATRTVVFRRSSGSVPRAQYDSTSQTLTVTVRSENTIQSIVTAINQQTSTSGVSAALGDGVNGSRSINYSSGRAPVTTSVTLAAPASGTIDYSYAEQELLIYTDGTLTASAAATAINASDYPDLTETPTDLAAAEAVGSRSTWLIPAGEAYTFAGGADAAARSPLGAAQTTSNNITTIQITGLLASVDRISDLRSEFSSFLVEVVTPSGGSDNDFVVVTTSADPGEQVFRVSLANGQDAGDRPTPTYLDDFVNGTFRVNVYYIGASYPANQRTTLAEFKTFWESVAPGSTYTETGDQSSRVTTTPSAFAGGRNFVAGSPIEFLLRGEDEADGKNIEVRYHRDQDNFDDLMLASRDSARNPDGVKVAVIAGTLLGAKPPEPPIAPIPMVPGGGGTSTSSAELIHTFTWTNTTSAQTNTNTKYNDYDYLMFVGYGGGAANDQDFITTVVRRADIPSSGTNARLWVERANNTFISIALTSAGQLTVNPAGLLIDYGRFEVYGTDSPIFTGTGSSGDGIAAVSSDSTLSGTGVSGSPLRVANPFTDADETKLDGIEAGAEVNDSAGEIVSKLEGLTGNSRLEASAIRNLPSGGGGGLSSVSTDDTISGDGTSGSPLAVANPFTAADETKLDGIAAGAEVNVQSDWNATSGDAQILNKPTIPAVPARAGAFTVADETKLDGIEANATADQTAGEIVGLIEGLSGNARLDATSLKNLPSGGGTVAAGPLQANPITNRSSAYTGSAQQTIDLIDQTQDTAYYSARVLLATINYTISGSVQEMAVVIRGSELDGYNMQLQGQGNFRVVLGLTGSAPVTAITFNPSGTTTAFQIQFFELVGAKGDKGDPGTGGISTVSTDATITGTGVSGSPLSVANPFTAADETKLDGIAAGAEVNVQADWNATAGDALILNKPTIPNLPAAPGAGSNTAKYELQIATDGTATWVSATGGDAPPAPSRDFRFGTSEDETPAANELTISSDDGTGTFPSYSGSRHWLIARDSSEADITSVRVQGQQIQQIGAFTKSSTQVAVSGTTYNVWVSNQLLTNPASTTIVVS